MRKFLPIGIYTAGFFFLSPNLLPRFLTHLYADGSDGLVSYWNMWWVKRAILHYHRLPFDTIEQFFPFGTTLLGQTLHPFNGLAAILLSPVLSVGHAYNLMMVFAFAVGGWTAFLLCRELTGSYWPSVAGGAIFTFSNYHFAHAQGHMNLVSLEWIPLFILCWRRFAQDPRPRLGIAAAAALFLVLLCDYYYFFYSVLVAGMYYLWVARERADLLYAFRGRFWNWAAFAVPALASAGVLSGALLFENWRDPLLGAHQSREFGMDVLAPFVPGGHWRFASWTEHIWSRWSANMQESSVHLGLGVVFLLFFVWRNRRDAKLMDLGFWFLVAAVFSVLSLGPSLHVAGTEIEPAPVGLPYAWASWVFPPLDLSGVPVRMMILVQLAAAVVCTAGIQLLLDRFGRRGAAWVTGLLLLTLFEYLPAPVPTTLLAIEPDVEFLRSDPTPGAVYDQFTVPTQALAGQTFHERPISLGYLARVPTSVARRHAEIVKLGELGDYDALCRFGFRFLIAGPAPSAIPNEERLTLGYSDPVRRVFRICAVSGASADKVASPGESSIEVERATYGGNCGAPEGNDTERIAAVCNGKSRCYYLVDYRIIGDPKVGCGKEYDVAYACSGTRTTMKTARVQSEAGLRHSAVLSCP